MYNNFSLKFFKVNDWFDILNSKVPKIDSRPRMAAFGLAKIEQEIILNKMEHVIKNLRVGKHKSMLPFQKGIVTSINALRMLFDNLKNDYNITYLLTYRSNQDPLELFFGVMRAKGGLYDHPTALEFKYRLRNFLLGKNECIMSNFSNVEKDSNITIEMDIDAALEPPVVDSLIEETIFMEDYLQGTD